MAIHVSASALKDFVACEQKVYYRIFEAGVSIPSKEMLMGTITHKVLEKEWNDLDKAIKLIDTLCNKYKMDIMATTSIEHFVYTYFERFKLMVTGNDKIEQRFKVKLYDDVYLVGVFDRISRGLVIDWKTNANPPKKIDGDIQFILYDLAYRLMYNKPSEGVYLAALKDGSLVRYNESINHSEVLINQLIPDFVKTIRSKNFTKTGLFNGSCYRCPYKIDCLGGDKDVVAGANPIKE